jgi:hypothetical protein
MLSEASTGSDPARAIKQVVPLWEGQRTRLHSLYARLLVEIDSNGLVLRIVLKVLSIKTKIADSRNELANLSIINLRQFFIIINVLNKFTFIYSQFT